MNGTKYSTDGTEMITREVPVAKLRLLALGLAAVFALILVIWASVDTWGRLDHLQQQVTGLRAESFYVGVRVRNDIQRLNETLLRYRLHADPVDAREFVNSTAQLKQSLQQNATNAVISRPERVFYERIESAYDDYLTESAKVLAANRAHWSSTQAKEFQDTYEKVHQQSEYLLGLCDTFIDNQTADFRGFLKQSTQTVAKFKELLQVCAALILALAAALVYLVYRGMIAPLRDRLTESEAIIARQEKLASLGVLAAGVAHEIRNPLTAIKFRLFSLKKVLTEEAHEDVEVITGEISRLERIVKDFLDFARPSEPQLTAMPAQRLLQGAHDLLRPQLEKSAIELKLETAESLWVRADAQQLKQVLINLIQNSADSIGRDGVITLRARRQSADVILEVTDNGKGIPPDVQTRLFDPFFTTKAGGTGLGLPIALRIVEKHGGKLRYQTAPNRGTTFRVALPEINNNES